MYYVILDFYCAAAQFAIELDGSQRYMPDGQQYDLERTAYLQAQRIEFLRFSNTDVLQNLYGLCHAID